jgi:hypothetical protein
MKTKLSEEIINEIIKLYKSSIPSTHRLANHFKLGHKKISKILNDNNVKINAKGGQKSHEQTQAIISAKTKVYSVTDKELVAICKKTGIKIKDPNNLSGKLTKHIFDNFDNPIIPKNTYQRKKYEIQFNKKWFEEYFTIQEVEVSEIRNCLLCDWTTTDIKNKSGCFQTHINENHGMHIRDYLMRFPEDIKYHPTYKSKLTRLLSLENQDDYIICEICKEKMKVISNTHLKDRHGLTPFEYKLKYPGALMNKNLTIRTAKRLNTFNLSDTIKRKQTRPELEICSYLDAWGIGYECSNRSILNGKEIDILLPDYNIGIEFNGNIHHTEFFGGKDRNYHLNKTIDANLKGYGLIQIFSDEWRNKKNLLLNKLAHIFNKANTIKLGARKCTIKIISTEEKNEFLEKYHIQGKDSSTVKLGAFYSDILVGVMTFKILKSSEFELTRLATNYDYNISGLGSKLLKFFIRNYQPTSIISFADRRWTLNKDCNLYTKLGFKLENILRPDYRYYHPNNHQEDRQHKFGFRKQILVKKYPTDLNMSMTETEMIKKLGYDRIWDCGLFKYKLSLS